MASFPVFFAGACFLTVVLSNKAQARGFECCEYNGKRIDCKIVISGKSLSIEWADGLEETYSLVSQKSFADRTYRNARGGLWKYLLHPQGNISINNISNDNHIFQPLRGCQ